MDLVIAIVAVLAIIFLVPLVVYGAASSFAGLDLPTESSPQRFMLGVLITKLGTAVAFVLVLHLTGTLWAGRLGLYALLWFGMFAASEIGDAISGRGTWREALLGIFSEAIYAPAGAFAAFRILGIS